MGGSTTSLPKSNWSFIRRDERYQIYQNEFGILAEKHVIMNDPRLKEEDELSTYLYRYNTPKPIVKVYRADYESGSDFCSNYKNILVFTEYIPYRLIDTRNLSHEQGLYVLSESLLGFHELYSHLGAFPVDHTLIGFNKDGQVRVWLTANFARNHFDNNNVILVSTTNPHGFDQRLQLKQEEEMVVDIWQAVEQHALFNLEFRNQVNAMQQINFYNIKEVLDLEIHRLQHVPARLKFEDKFGIVESSRSIAGNNSVRSGYNSQVRKNWN